MERTFYVHRPLGDTVQAVGGSYRLVKEVRLPLDGGGGREGGEVLYLVGHAIFDTTCCGVGGCGYALVQGLVVRWQAFESADGLPMTEVEPVADAAFRARLTKLIKEREKVLQVNFR